MSPVPPLDEKTLKSYPYFWNWIQALGRDWQEVGNISIQSTPIEVPSDDGWRHFLPNPEFTASITFNNGDTFSRIGRWTEGKMNYIPVENDEENVEGDETACTA